MFLELLSIVGENCAIDRPRRHSVFSILTEAVLRIEHTSAMIDSRRDSPSSVRFDRLAALIGAGQYFSIDIEKRRIDDPSADHTITRCHRV